MVLSRFIKKLKAVLIIFKSKTADRKIPKKSAIKKEIFIQNAIAISSIKVFKQTQNADTHTDTHQKRK
ncbi:hypothetical protein CHL10074_03730 [Campylobacter hyointestinalis subsp. lawsonii]|nr:hypothetical protein CHL10074_03730 [Campylobacter hyointestinalis subsp. lawsonii]RAZ64463.1 hypothetical protein CHL9767_03615 [Campylobacter hyointestinalis subsp. lawsonii]